MTNLEALTAQINVIRIGPRQLTLSMARQLDQFPINTEHITKFRTLGRIRTGTKLRLTPGFGPEITPQIELIGTHTETGELMTLICHQAHIENTLESQYAMEQMEKPLIILGGMK